MFHRLRIPLCHTNDSNPPQTMGTVLDQPYQVRVTVPIWRTPSASPRNSSAPISAIPLQSLTSPPPLDSRFGLCSGFSATHMATLQCSFCSIYAYKQRAKLSCAAMLLRSGTWQRSFCFQSKPFFKTLPQDSQMHSLAGHPATPTKRCSYPIRPESIIGCTLVEKIVKMRDDRIPVDKYHRIGRRLVRNGNSVG